MSVFSFLFVLACVSQPVFFFLSLSRFPSIYVYLCIYSIYDWKLTGFRIVLETDPLILAKSSQIAKKDDIPVSELTVSQVLNSANGILRRVLLT